MKRFPLQPLDAEERALLAALPRLHGRAQPGEGVDARILAAARETRPAVPVERAPRRWLAPLGVAASLVVAAGLVWQQLPPAAAPTAQQEIALGLQAADDVGRAFACRKALVELLAVVEVVDQHEHLVGVGAEIEADRRPGPVDRLLPLDLVIKRARTIAQADHERAALAALNETMAAGFAALSLAIIRTLLPTG